MTQVRVDHQLGLQLGEDAEINVQTGAAMDQGGGGQTSPLVPERQEVADALGLFGRAVTEATAFKDGRLLVEFDQGARLTVAPDADFEAWNITGPGALRVVCMPGGELAIWR
ncbi:hypothetical protein BX283_0071 [Streptomyces sp. TLI_146]|nr:hypothetical protein BX283_0071 [Streptomyces sp. TLI_146]